MPKWERRRLRLKKNHGWKSEPGCQIFVADRGAVRFDLPRGWVVEPGKRGSIKFMDRKPPDDDCTLEMTVFYLNEEIDWSGLTVGRLVGDLGTKRDGEPEDVPEFDDDGEPYVEPTEILEILPVTEFHRDGMSVAWNGRRYIDPKENREVSSRLLMARKWNIQPLITFAFWSDQAKQKGKAWDILLKTLILGDYVEDPTQRV